MGIKTPTGFQMRVNKRMHVWTFTVLASHIWVMHKMKHSLHREIDSTESSLNLQVNSDFAKCYFLASTTKNI